MRALSSFSAHSLLFFAVFFGIFLVLHESSPFSAEHAETTKASVACVFGPQHGFFQTEQDNMLETPDSAYVYRARDPKTGAVSPRTKLSVSPTHAICSKLCMSV